MKKTMRKPRKQTSTRLPKYRKDELADVERPIAGAEPPRTGEKAIDATGVDQDVPESFRQPLPDRAKRVQDETNWSQAEDRGEDLINERDPFVQQPERDTDIPPELVQERAYRLYEQRGGNSGDDLADWFEAERQLRGERNK